VADGLSGAQSPQVDPGNGLRRDFPKNPAMAAFLSRYAPLQAVKQGPCIRAVICSVVAVRVSELTATTLALGRNPYAYLDKLLGPIRFT